MLKADKMRFKVLKQIVHLLFIADKIAKAGSDNHSLCIFNLNEFLEGEQAIKDSLYYFKENYAYKEYETCIRLFDETNKVQFIELDFQIKSSNNQ